ncbi:hypothetical protein [Ornithinimicrobium murale]|uniref:hypothetical protein n=1 Tax=Ornithinimicrobium murale TaxID=1050153 RepID=UPI0013B3E2BB|nr:hypothetical protein [Ornithinimicrobium murale]
MSPAITIEPAVAITIVICLTVAYVAKKIAEVRAGKASRRQVSAQDVEGSGG